MSPASVYGGQAAPPNVSLQVEIQKKDRVKKPSIEKKIFFIYLNIVQEIIDLKRQLDELKQKLPKGVCFLQAM